MKKIRKITINIFIFVLVTTIVIAGANIIRVGSDLVPEYSNLDLGTSTAPWNNLYVNSFNIATLNFTSLIVEESASFTTEVQNTCNRTFNADIDWSLGNKQAVNISESCNISFSPFVGAGNMILKINTDWNGTDTMNWTYDYPTTEILWAGKTEPTLTTTGNSTDISSFYYDGEKYYGMLSTDFGVPE